MKKITSLNLDKDLLDYCQADVEELGFSLSYIINNLIKEAYSFKNKAKGKQQVSFLLDPDIYGSCYERSLKIEQSLSYTINWIVRKFFRQPPKNHPDYVFLQYLRDLFPPIIWEKINICCNSEDKKVVDKLIELFSIYSDSK